MKPLFPFVAAGGFVSLVRSAPEPLKRRLRPVLLKGVRTVLAVPGGRPAAMAALSLTPELREFLRRRYRSYRLLYLEDDERGPELRPGELTHSESVRLRWLHGTMNPGRTN